MSNEDSIDLDSLEGQADDLGRLITAIARAATQIAAAKVDPALAELDHSQARLLEQFEDLDPSAAAALRDIAADVLPAPPPPPDPLDFCSPIRRLPDPRLGDAW